MPDNQRPHSFVHAARRLPAFRRLSAVQLAALAEVVLLTRDHLQRLTPQERRRVVQLIRVARGRPRNLSEDDRGELSALIAKAQPRLLAGETIDALSPIALPRRLLFGRRRSP